MRCSCIDVAAYHVYKYHIMELASMCTVRSKHVRTTYTLLSLHSAWRETDTGRTWRAALISDHIPHGWLQKRVEDRNYVEFEFAAKSSTYIRIAIAVVTIANGAHACGTSHHHPIPSCIHEILRPHCCSPWCRELSHKYGCLLSVTDLITMCCSIKHSLRSYYLLPGILGLDATCVRHT